ncbi:hypothetical protein HDV57DRAFT_473152 [Trichoderma longibrachiatum]
MCVFFACWQFVCLQHQDGGGGTEDGSGSRGGGEDAGGGRDGGAGDGGGSPGGLAVGGAGDGGGGLGGAGLDRGDGGADGHRRRQRGLGAGRGAGAGAGGAAARHAGRDRRGLALDAAGHGRDDAADGLAEGLSGEEAEGDDSEGVDLHCENDCGVFFALLAFKRERRGRARVCLSVSQKSLASGWTRVFIYGGVYICALGLSGKQRG